MISRLKYRLSESSIWTSHRHLKLRTPQGKFDFPSKICSSFNLLCFSKCHHQASMTKARNLESLLFISSIPSPPTCTPLSHFIVCPPETANPAHPVYLSSRGSRHLLQVIITSSQVYFGSLPTHLHLSIPSPPIQPFRVVRGIFKK